MPESPKPPTPTPAQPAGWSAARRALALGASFGLVLALAVARPGGDPLGAGLIDPIERAWSVALAPVLFGVLFLLRGTHPGAADGHRGAGAAFATLAPLGAGLGLALALLLPRAFAPGTTALLPLGTWLGVAAALALLGLDLRGRPIRVAPTEADAPPSPSAARASGAELLGAMVAGAGAAVAWGTLDHRVSLLGLGEAPEGLLRALVVAVLMALAGLAFGGLVARPGVARLAALAGPVLVALAAATGLVVLAPLSGQAGFERQLARFGLDLSVVGGLRADSLLAARGLVLPAFAAGLTLAAVARGRVLGALLLGVGAGLLARPALLADLGAGPDGAPLSHGTFADGLPRLGLLLALVGALLALTLTWRAGSDRRGSSAVARGLTLVVLAVATGLGQALPPVGPPPTSPWLQREVLPLWAADTPHGLATIEPDAAGDPVLTLDRLRLTPDARTRAADRARLEATVALAEALRPGAWRLLVVGQLTPERWLDLADATDRLAGGAAAPTIDWCTPWEALQPAIRPILEADREGVLPDPLALAEARAGLRAGRWDLAVALAPAGPEQRSLSLADPPRAAAPVPTAPTTEGAAATLLWVDPRASAFGPGPLEALVAGAGLADLGVGLLALPPGAAEVGRLVLAPPSGAPSAYRRLATRPAIRHFADQAALVAALAAARPAGDEAALASGADLVAFLGALAPLAALQREGSPWLGLEEGLELSPEALATLRDATLALPGPPLGEPARGVWEQLAAALAAKRRPGLALEVLGPLVERFGPWPALAATVGRAHLELLDAEAGVATLAPLAAAGALGPADLAHLADALGELGEWAEAARVLERALALAPGDALVGRRRVEALLRAGDPAGLAAAEAWLAEAPEDEGIRALLQAGPAPPPPTGFDPTPLGTHADDH